MTKTIEFHGFEKKFANTTIYCCIIIFVVSVFGKNNEIRIEKAKHENEIMETILQLDYSIFEWINQDLQNTFFDAVMPWWRSKYTWIPFYGILIIFSIVKFKFKGFYFILFLAMTMGVSDTMSSKVIKNAVQRDRPCKNLQIKGTINLLVRCGSGYSFTSSHATNHFTMAVFLFLTFCRRYKFLKLPLLLWAGSIALGQVYVGVHFPFDVLAGGVLGTIIGFIFSWVYKRWELISIPEFSYTNRA